MGKDLLVPGGIEGNDGKPQSALPVDGAKICTRFFKNTKQDC